MVSTLDSESSDLSSSLSGTCLCFAVLVSVMVSIPTCHAGDQGSIPDREKAYPLGFSDKESASNVRDPHLILGSGRSPGERNSYPLQHSCLENPMDRRAWRATVQGVTKSRTRLSDQHTATSMAPLSLQIIVLYSLELEIRKMSAHSKPRSSEEGLQQPPPPHTATKIVSLRKNSCGTFLVVQWLRL